MIRYPITKSKLEEEIKEAQPGWLEAAAEKTAGFRLAGNFNEPSGKSSWSEIKAVFMKLQHNKCAYCERKLGDVEFGKGEHDVEHFRPKKGVKVWPTEKMKKSKDGRYNYDFATGDADEKGYYLLAYNFLNYATSCSSCNQSLKSNYFPIAGTRLVTSEDFKELKKEKSFLIFPLGSLDVNPENLITFNGILPVPKAKTGAKHWRARVTIDFFALDTREDLNELRAEILLNLLLASETVLNPNASAASKRLAQKIIDLATSPHFPQTNCARAFVKLCQTDIEMAREFGDRAEKFLDSLSARE